MLPHIKYIMKEPAVASACASCRRKWIELEDLFALVDTAIVDEPPISIRDGGFIKEGYHEEVDRLRHAKTEGKTWLAKLEAEEREKTGIKNR